MSVGSMDVEELKRRLDSGERLALLDVREDHERDHAAIAPPPGVVDLFIPMGQIAARRDEIAGAELPVVVYCHHGVRSMVVARWLSSRGISGLWNLEGGIDAWSLRVDRGVPRY